MNNTRKIMEVRAEVVNLKGLEEQRSNLQAELEQILQVAREEVRAVTRDESERFDELENSIKAIDITISAEERVRNLSLTEERAGQVETRAEQQEKLFESFLRGKMEERADIKMTKNDNGSVIPSTIADRIVETVKDICPIYSMSEKFNLKGSLTFPVYDETEQKITMAYADEFQKLSSTSGKFKSVTLTGFLAGALSKISRSLINNSQFDIVSYAIKKMAEAVAEWIENELLNGTEGKIEGLSNLSNAQIVFAESELAFNLDDLMDVQEAVPDKLQGGCIWLMNKSTRTLIRKMKDNDGNYILNKDAASKWGYTLFGKDVYTSDNISKVGSGARPVFYGDLSGLYVKLTEDSSIEVLREKYADEHAIGIVTWMEVDGKVIEPQKFSALQMA